jgi:serine/threonine protein kinase
MLSARGQVKVLDFGLARSASPIETAESTALSVITETGMIAGTVPYMSPEQVRGEPLDARTDIFSFGTLLYHLVTSKGPFEAPSTAETISAVLTREPLPLRRDGRPVHLELQRIVNNCLEKNRDRRYQSITDLDIDLENFRRQAETSGGSSHSLPLFDNQLRRDEQNDFRDRPGICLAGAGYALKHGRKQRSRSGQLAV